MLSNIQGPGLFLAQYMSDEPPFNNFASACKAAAEMGYKGVQIPTWDGRVIDLAIAANSQTYADELTGIAAEHGLAITELSTHLQGQLVAVHPAYQSMYAGFAPTGLPYEQWQGWATDQLLLAAKASERLNLNAHVTFSGSLLWPYVYPWPQRPAGLVEMGFAELAKRWRPILDAYAQAGISMCYELHPGEDLYDGYTFESFVDELDGHPAACINYDPSHFVLQQLDYVAFIDLYHERIKAFHVKDAEFRPNGKGGVYGGYQGWVDRPGRFRSVGDGQVDFGQIFAKLAQYDYDGWAVVEWECALKDAIVGGRESAERTAGFIIQTTAKAFDDFAGSERDEAMLKQILGL